MRSNTMKVARKYLSNNSTPNGGRIDEEIINVSTEELAIISAFVEQSVNVDMAKDNGNEIQIRCPNSQVQKAIRIGNDYGLIFNQQFTNNGWSTLLFWGSSINFTANRKKYHGGNSPSKEGVNPSEFL